MELLEKREYQRADTDEEREAIFRFRYQCYLDEGAILPNPEERFSDKYDELGNAWTIGIHIEGRFVAVRCASMWPRQSIPNDRQCGPSARRCSRCLTPVSVVIDPTRFTVDRNVSRGTRILPT